MIVQMFVTDSGAHLASAEGDRIHVGPMGLNPFAVCSADAWEEVESELRMVGAVDTKVLLRDGIAQRESPQVQPHVGRKVAKGAWSDGGQAHTFRGAFTCLNTSQAVFELCLCAVELGEGVAKVLELLVQLQVLTYSAVGNGRLPYAEDTLMLVSRQYFRTFTVLISRFRNFLWTILNDGAWTPIEFSTLCRRSCLSRRSSQLTTV